jgi:hypothetical protein
VWGESEDIILSTLSNCFTNRQLFKGKLIDAPLSDDQYQALCQQYVSHFGVSNEEASFFFVEHVSTSNTYSENGESIGILYKDGVVRDIAEASDIEHSANIVLLLWNSAVKPLPKSTNYYKNRDKGELTKEAENLQGRGFLIGYPGTMYAILAKNRNGERGIDTVLKFNGNTGKISYQQDDEDAPF